MSSKHSSSLLPLALLGARGSSRQQPKARHIWMVLGLILVIVLGGACGSSGGSAPAAAATGRAATMPQSASAATNGGKVPNFDHIYLIVFENKESSDVIGSSSAAYINSLVDKGGLAANYAAITHPSQPNYLAIWSGSTQGIVDDSKHSLSGTTLGDQLTAAGKSWKVYAENYPYGQGNTTKCFNGSTASGGPDGSGNYARKHNPAMTFTEINQDPAACAKHITDLSSFNAASADFSLIVPNLCHDMHDCSVKTGDNWLQSWLPAHILDTPTWTGSNNAIFITWDEGDSNKRGGGLVPLIVLSSSTPAMTRSNQPYDHYSLLRTIEASWNLHCLGHSCEVTPMSDLFGS